MLMLDKRLQDEGYIHRPDGSRIQDCNQDLERRPEKQQLTSNNPDYEHEELVRFRRHGAENSLARRGSSREHALLGRKLSFVGVALDIGLDG